MKGRLDTLRPRIGEQEPMLKNAKQGVLEEAEEIATYKTILPLRREGRLPRDRQARPGHPPLGAADGDLPRAPDRLPDQGRCQAEVSRRRAQRSPPAPAPPPPGRAPQSTRSRSSSLLQPSSGGRRGLEVDRAQSRSGSGPTQPGRDPGAPTRALARGRAPQLSARPGVGSGLRPVWVVRSSSREGGGGGGRVLAARLRCADRPPRRWQQGCPERPGFRIASAYPDRRPHP